MNYLNGIIKERPGVVLFLFTGLCTTLISSGSVRQTKGDDPPEHRIVFFEDGRFAAWPANGGMWAWGNEILVCFTVADHKEKEGHSLESSTQRNMLARSLDGGESWILEDAYRQGITGLSHDNQIGDKAEAPKQLKVAINFSHPGFAMLFKNENFHYGPSSLYYTYDRGRSWKGPYGFPELDTPGIGARTDYIIDGKHEALVFLTAAKSDKKEGRIICARTTDGGKTWSRIAWIGPEPEGYSIMPSSARLSGNEIVTLIRHFEPGFGVRLISYFSEDNAKTWQKLDDPVTYSMGSPPSLIQLPDKRLVLLYAARSGSGEGSRICAKISSDGGRSWGEEKVLREKEGANGDIGYTRLVRRSDGKLVIAYYWNHALLKDKQPYRHIAVTIWDPGK